jgi:diaminopimelate epimerase
VQLRFSKYEGLGNDFLVVERDQAPQLTPAQVQKLCDRHFGVGGDGVLLTGLEQGQPFMTVINADGSVPEMCGNGLRCVALYLVQREIMREPAFTVRTDAGPHRVAVSGGNVQVDMRPASLEANQVLRAGSGTFVDQPFAVDARTLHVTCVSMGNPHAVLFDDVHEHMATLGPRIEKDARFSAGANVGFARMRDADNLELTVWERGVGFTLACGTGACAAAVAAVETGRAQRERPLTVHLPGGPLTIRVGEPGTPLSISMTGPARHVFDGAIDCSRADPRAATELEAP